jgi:hypothetical protein
MSLKKYLILMQRNPMIGMTPKMENGNHRKFQIQSAKKWDVESGRYRKTNV